MKVFTCRPYRPPPPTFEELHPELFKKLRLTNRVFARLFPDKDPRTSLTKSEMSLFEKEITKEEKKLMIDSAEIGECAAEEDKKNKENELVSLRRKVKLLTKKTERLSALVEKQKKTLKKQQIELREVRKTRKYVSEILLPKLKKNGLIQ